ncbi:sulfate ABC transporter permease subunit CysW, partial [Klebsiella michiganensis]
LVEWRSRRELADADAGVGEGPGQRVTQQTPISNSHVAVQSPLEGSAA